MNLKVICTYWRKGKTKYKGRQYTDEWVYRLRDNVKKSLKHNHEFICMTNKELPDVKTIELKHDYPAWWSKIELFRPDIEGDRFLYLDLDTIPLQDLDSFVHYAGDFIALHNKGIAHSQRKNKGRVNGICSGVMVWNKDEVNFIYNEFNTKWISILPGDQDWINYIFNEKQYQCNTFPRGWTKMLRDTHHQKSIGNSKILICSPNGWRMDIVAEYKGERYKWVEKLWKE